jgi:nucleotide-binding universal stress UspA family protein
VYRRVVVPLDGSSLAEAILPFILDIAGPLDMEVHLVRVIQPVPPEVIEGSRHVVLEDVPARMREASDYLAGAAARLDTRGIRVRTDVRRGEPVTEIVAAAKDAGADLIAMTTHGRSGLGRLLFGSVAEAVLRQADLPVFLMRLTEKQVEVSTPAPVA